MFTGIIEELGTIAAINSRPGGVSLTINALTVLEDTRIGDSIAVNGVCLTVTSIGTTTFTADLLDETRRKTNLEQAKSGTVVNLERSLTPTSRMGGHFVLGHVDQKVPILKRTTEGADIVFECSLPVELKPFIAPKGSITINGISLTVVDVNASSFSVHLIPHTLEQTNLVSAKAGDIVNLEVDVLARYILNMTATAQKKESTITKSFLQEKGFF